MPRTYGDAPQFSRFSYRRVVLFAAMHDARDPRLTADDRSEARLRRDQALRRVGHMRRWVIGSSAALTAGFAVFVAQVAHGRSSSTTARSGASSARQVSQSEPALPAVANPGDLGLQGPDQVPQPAAPSPPQSTPAPSDSSGGGAPAVSGGS
ncbi:MAG: hypothetical protein ACXVFH_07755 [Solirubrobacteraceae bacterium]